MEGNISSAARLPVYVIEPRSAHTHTAIVLHGRGSSGEGFAEELFATSSSNDTSLATRYPGWRWVFPSSKALWSTDLQDFLPAWFEAHSLVDTTLRQDLQLPGILESSKYVQSLIEEEIKLLEGKTENLLLGGLNQGGALAMWMLLCQRDIVEPKIGGFFAASAWIPFADNITRVLKDDGAGRKDKYDCRIRSMMQDSSSTGQIVPRRHSTIKVFLGHSCDDEYIDVKLGRQASKILAAAGFDVRWRRYSDHGDQEGRSVRQPNEIDDIAQLLGSVYISTSPTVAKKPKPPRSPSPAETIPVSVVTVYHDDVFVGFCDVLEGPVRTSR